MAHGKSIDTAKALGLLETVYDDSSSDDDWRSSVLDGALAIVGASSGGWYDYESAFDAHGAFGLQSLTTRVSRGPNIRPDGNRVDTWAGTPPPVLQQLFGRSLAMTFRSLIGDHEPHEIEAWRRTWRAPVVDNLGIVARELSGAGVLLVSGAESVLRCTPSDRRFLDRVSFHFGAALRLRRTPHARRMETAEAVLSPTGRILHATEISRTKTEQLDEGRKRRDHARSQTGDPAKALEVWKGLVAGRWSLVDHFDTDGKRFLLAMKNPPHVDRRADLTPRERRVCALAAVGHRDKEIAYMLGLTKASVSASMHRARIRLRVKTRVELIAAWRANDE